MAFTHRICVLYLSQLTQLTGVIHEVHAKQKRKGEVSRGDPCIF